VAGVCGNEREGNRIAGYRSPIQAFGAFDISRLIAMIETQSSAYLNRKSTEWGVATER